MPAYHAVYCRTSFTGDDPQAVFRYSAEAEEYAAKQAGRPDYREAGYSVERIRLQIEDAATAAL